MKENNQTPKNSNKILLLPLYLVVFALALSAVSVSFRTEKRAQLLVLSPPYPTPACKKGLNVFTVDLPCPNGGFKYAKYVCYDQTKGEFTPAKCRNSLILRQAAEAVCNKISDRVCPKPTTTPTPTIYPYGPTPTVHY